MTRHMFQPLPKRKTKLEIEYVDNEISNRETGKPIQMKWLSEAEKEIRSDSDNS